MESDRNLWGIMRVKINSKKLFLLVTAVALVIFLAAGSSSAGASHFRNAKPGGGNFTPLFMGIGDPLPGVAKNNGDVTNFNNGLLNFQETETLKPASDPTGPPGQLGPLFNNNSCAACHSNPARGGGALDLMEQRLSTGGPPVRIFAVDHMLSGPPGQQDTLGAIFPYGTISAPLGAQIGMPDNVPSVCQKEEIARGFSPSLPICVAGSANDTGLTGTPTCIAHRQSLPLFGDGLVEATSDATFQAIAAAEPVEVRGTVRMVADGDNFNGSASEVSPGTIAALGIAHVARFGWKDDFSTLVGFSADAYLNEIGITNDLNSKPNSTCAIGVQQYGIALQTADDPEDSVDSTGRSDIDRFTDFMRSLRPPPQVGENADAVTGRSLFSKVGCASCHTPSITTAANPSSFMTPTINGTPISSSLNSTLANVNYQPYGDFLLHDMGSLGDGVNDDPTILHDERMMRTMPLWGLRTRVIFLHDGRATNLPSAIALHDGQGAAAAAAFAGLSSTQQNDVIEFLNTL
jgi:CxxC motif-containing protein (DUF1111 family)